MRHCWENEIPNFFRKCDFFRRSNFFLENPIFFIKNPNFLSKIRFFFLSKIRIFSKTYEIRGVVLCYIYYFSKTYEIRCLVTFRVSLLHRLCRVTYLQYLTQCGVKPGLYSVRRSTQTELRKRIYADRRIMAFILLRRSRRVCMRIVGVFTLGICAIPTA